MSDDLPVGQGIDVAPAARCAGGMTQVQQLSHSLRTGRKMTLGLLEGIPKDRWLFQPIPTGQHALWIVGHLAVGDDWGMISLGVTDRRLTMIEAHFGKDQPITSNAAAYPPVDELLNHFHSAHDRLVKRLGETSDEDLSRPTSGEIVQFAPTLGTLLQSHIWHEGFHGGQLAMIRRALGLGVRFG